MIQKSRCFRFDYIKTVFYKYFLCNKKYNVIVDSLYRQVYAL